MDNPRGIGSPRSTSLRSGSTPLVDHVENPESILRPVPSSVLPAHVQSAPGPHTSSTGDVCVTPVNRNGIARPTPGPSATAPEVPQTDGPIVDRNTPPIGSGLQPGNADLQTHLELWLEDLVQVRLPPLFEEVLNKLIPKILPQMVLESSADVLEAWLAPDGGDSTLKTTLREAHAAVHAQLLEGGPGPTKPVKVMPAITQQPLNIFGEGTTPRMANGAAQPSGNRDTHPMGFSLDQEERVNQKNRVSQDPEGTNLARRTRSSRKKKHDNESDNQYGMRRRTRRSKRQNYSDVDSSSCSETDRSERSSDPDVGRVPRHRSSKSTLKAIRPLNDVFRKAADYRTYRLERTGNRYAASHKAIRNARKGTDVQISRVTFTSSDPIEILGFLTQFRNACNHNGVSEGKAV